MNKLLTSLAFISAITYGDEAAPVEDIPAEYSSFGWGVVNPVQQVGTITPQQSEPAEQECPAENPIRSPSPMHAGVRHIEGKGIGYQKGYTTAELFLSPDVERMTALPFIDLRGHVFDDGRFALNAGIGFRYRAGCRSYGANAFYDYRDTKHHRYNQAGIGLESLGAVWDFRVNGYLPFGKTESRWFEPKFSKFKEHHLFIRRKQEFSMRGADAEIGLHFLRNIKQWDLYTAAGPYYFEGKGKNTYGGKGRLGTIWKNYFSLELSGSYDNIFKGIVQGQIGLRIPFGPRSAIKSSEKCPCSDMRKLMDRMVQPVARDEIIVVDKRRKDFLARDPATGNPLFFWFVNNLSHSAGTFESPFPNLSQAISASKPKDIIYIYPGDGTSSGLIIGAPFQLKDHQKLLGTGFSYTFATQFGRIKIPVLASGRPQVAGGDAISIITVANNNTVAGLSITALDAMATNYCIGSSANVSNLNIYNNILNVLSAGSGNAVLLDSFTGTLNASYNLINAPLFASFGNGIVVTNNDTDAVYNITHNTFLGAAMSGSGIHITNSSSLTGRSYASANISHNSFDNFSEGIFMEITSRQVFYSHAIENNTFTNCSIGMDISTSSTSNGDFKINYNSFANSGSASNVSITATTVCLQFLYNQATSKNYSFTSTMGFPFKIEPPIGNTPEPLLQGLTLVPAGSCGN